MRMLLNHSLPQIVSLMSFGIPDFGCKSKCLYPWQPLGNPLENVTICLMIIRSYNVNSSTMNNINSLF